MKSAVLVFPGINRERDMARALKLASGREAQMVWHAETALPKGTDLVVVPAGSAVSACHTIAASWPETSLSARAISRSRLIPGKTRTADFISNKPPASRDVYRSIVLD